MHFLDVDKTSSIKKSTFLIAILFVISFAIGLGGGLQQKELQLKKLIF
jgi:hypothetical protein